MRGAQKGVDVTCMWSNDVIIVDHVFSSRLMEYQRTDLRRRKVAREGLQEVLRYEGVLVRPRVILTCSD